MVNSTVKKYIIRGQLIDVFVATEWLDGCVYRTKSLGFIVMRSDASALKPNAIKGSPSTHVLAAVLKEL